MKISDSVTFKEIEVNNKDRKEFKNDPFIL